METRLDQLLSIAGDALGPAGLNPPVPAGQLGDELMLVLSQVNGFYAFESALHVRASGQVVGEPGLEEWNVDALWRDAYGAMAEQCRFFAEDVFGGQFAIKSGEIVAFDPETGNTERVASSLEDWADRILADYEVLTGFPIAHAWQTRHGPIPRGQRLVPKRPFVLGGEYSITTSTYSTRPRPCASEGSSQCRPRIYPRVQR